MGLRIMGWDLEEWIKRPSSQLTCVFVGVPIGVFAGAFLVSPFPILLGLEVVVVLFFWRLPKKLFAFLLVFLAFLWLGFFRYSIVAHRPALPLPNSPVSVSGFVASLPTVRASSQRFTFNTDAYGKVLASVPRFPFLLGGEHLSLSCVLKQPEPFDGFPYDRYLAVRGIYATCRSFDEPVRLSGDRGLSAIQHLRSALRFRAEQILHEPYAALLLGLLTGDDLLSEPVEDVFRRAGLAHIVVASGQNVAFLTLFLFSLLMAGPFTRRAATGITLVALLGYAVLAGAEAPIVRATIMGAVVLFGRAFGREAHARNLLLLALSVMLFEEPRLLRDDLGFQLSFASTAGLLVFEPKISAKLLWVPPVFGIRASLSSSLAAILATAPILAFTQTTFSFVAPLANLFILPILPFLLAIGLIVLSLSFLSLEGARLLSLPVAGGLTALTHTAAALADLPFASLNLSDHRLLFGIITFGSLGIMRVLFRSVSSVKHVAICYPLRYVLVLLLLLPIPALATALPHRDFRAWYLSIGQGDATILEFPNKTRWLVDAGPDESVLWKVGQILPWYDRRIDTLVLTHADADHVTGSIELAQRYDVKNIWLPEIDTTSSVVRELLRLVPERLQTQAAPAHFTLGDVDVSLLSPAPELLQEAKDRNEISLVLSIRYGETSVLFLGDIFARIEATLQNKLSHMDVLKVAHHGSKTSTSSALLKATTPDAAVISSGKDNRYGHPHASVLGRLKTFGTVPLRTDTDGDILLESKGEEPVLTVHALAL